MKALPSIDVYGESGTSSHSATYTGAPVSVVTDCSICRNTTLDVTSHPSR